MATIELVQTASDWKDNNSGSPLPAGKWTVSGNNLLLAGSVLESWHYDYGPDRLATDRDTPASVFRADPYDVGIRSAFMAKTSGHLVFEATVTSCSADLSGCGMFMLVEMQGYSGSWSPAIVAIDAGVAVKAVACDGNFPGMMAPTFGTGLFSGVGFIPWHIATNQPLAAFLGAAVTWSLSVRTYWTDSFLSVPLFWTNLVGQTEV